MALGYLDQISETKRYFPSLRLHRLCNAVPEGIAGGTPLADLVDSIQSRVDETTTISRLDGLFTMPIYVRTATHREALRVTPGLTGGVATLSVVGRTLLSMLPPIELDRFLMNAKQWVLPARIGVPLDPKQLANNLTFVREHGYLCSYGQLLPGVGAVSCPLPVTVTGDRLAITVAGSAARIERRGQQIINTLLRDVQGLAGRASIASDRPVLSSVTAVGMH